MAKRAKKREVDPHTSEKITIGDISGGTGIAIGTKAKAIVNQYPRENLDQIAVAFSALAQAVSKLPEGADKIVAENAVQTLEDEARKGNGADEGKIQKWLDFLAETAPDAWEVAINTFTNPILGIGTAFKKIAEKAKAKRGEKEANQKK